MSKLSPADIPPMPDRLSKRPIRQDFISEAEYDDAVAQHTLAAAAREELVRERRKLMEKLRDQGRDRRGRDQSGRARPSDDGAL